jgi:DNA-directed RNA polymerase subunit M/transcription elongation factor TFIIS
MFCSACGRVMDRRTADGAVVYVCSCGQETPGAPEDARVAGEDLGAGEITSMYEALIRNAPHDPAIQLVARGCPDCGRDYMAQLRVGEAEIIIFRCKCGHTARPDAA